MEATQCVEQGRGTGIMIGRCGAAHRHSSLATTVWPTAVTQVVVVTLACIGLVGSHTHTHSTQSRAWDRYTDGGTAWTALGGPLSPRILHHDKITIKPLHLKGEHERARRDADAEIAVKFTAYGRVFDLRMKRTDGPFVRSPHTHTHTPISQRQLYSAFRNTP